VDNSETAEAPQKFIEVWHGVVGLVVALLTIAGMWIGYQSATQAQIEGLKERTTKTEYQNQISIEERKDLRAKTERIESLVNEVLVRQARSDTKLDRLLGK